MVCWRAPNSKTRAQATIFARGNLKMLSSFPVWAHPVQTHSCVHVASTAHRFISEALRRCLTVFQHLCITTQTSDMPCEYSTKLLCIIKLIALAYNGWVVLRFLITVVIKRSSTLVIFGLSLINLNLFLSNLLCIKHHF